MSRTFNHKRNWFGGVKKALKSGCKAASRADARMKIEKILADIDSFENIIFYRYQDYDNPWNYD